MAAQSSTISKKPKKSTKPKAPKKPKIEAAAPSMAASARREIGAIVVLALALALLLALLSFRAADLTATGAPHNLIGPVGVKVGNVLLTIVGVGAFFMDAMLWFFGFAMLIGRRIDSKTSEILGQLLFVLSGTILAHLALFNYTVLDHMPGGMVGEFCGEILRGLFGTVGTYIIASTALLLSLILATDMSLGGIVRRGLGQMHRLQAYLRHRVAVRREFKRRLAEEREKLLSDDSLADQARAEAELSVAPIASDRYEFQENFEDEVEEKVASGLSRFFKRKKSRREAPSASQTDAPAPKQIDTVPAKAAPSPADKDDDHWEMGAPLNTEDDIDAIASKDVAPAIKVGGEAVAEEEDDADDVVDMASERRPVVNGPAVDFGPQIVQSEGQKRAAARKKLLAEEDGQGVIFKPKRKGEYEIPPLNYLNYDNSDGVAVDAQVLREMAAQIEKTLADFKVDGTIVEICPGPVITMFEFSPAPGVKISRIANLSDDLAMALSAYSVRIVAPIPGKGVVGIEVPNPTREMVWLKEIIADEAFQEDKKMQLPMALGKNTEGGPVIADLAKMPHLLVAGATGSGKSVAVNSMICSLLYKHTPDDVRMIMVDPKMLEFSIYADIPHLLLPVVTDPKQATVALNWAVQEMERRYQALADMSVRNIKSYNQKVEVLTKQAEIDQLEGREETAALKKLGIDAQGNPQHTRLPYIVVIIDEFADLMMTASKDVEQAVARLAQKARAAGIHLILATQRPSTDVITGLIKANFPTRVALRVTSKTDSRVILDNNGAENLLGNGDMLFVPPGSSALERVHGAYVSEKEIEKVVDFLKEQGQPQYDDSILADEDEDAEEAIEDIDKDEHYEEAVRLVVDSRQASISMLQRKLRVGYNRAARMVDIMEIEGIVGASDGYKPREVLVDMSPY